MNIWNNHWWFCIMAKKYRVSMNFGLQSKCQFGGPVCIRFGLPYAKSSFQFRNCSEFLQFAHHPTQISTYQQLQWQKMAEGCRLSQDCFLICSSLFPGHPFWIIWILPFSAVFQSISWGSHGFGNDLELKINFLFLSQVHHIDWSLFFFNYTFSLFFNQFPQVLMVRVMVKPDRLWNLFFAQVILYQSCVTVMIRDFPITVFYRIVIVKEDS